MSNPLMDNVSGKVKLADVICDFDDLQNTATGLKELKLLKERFPGFKATLFAIPLRCSRIVIEEIESFDWLQLAFHGLGHTDNYEAMRWNKADTLFYLKWAMRVFPNWKHIFKAPGWQISDECYQGLLELGFAVADQSYNDARRPKELKVYNTSHPWIVHGHTWDMSYPPYNGIGQILKEDRFPFTSETKFHWIEEVL